MAITQHEKKLYVAGGNEKYNNPKTVWITRVRQISTVRSYDIDNGTWTELPSLPVSSNAGALFVVTDAEKGKNFLVHIGGISTTYWMKGTARRETIRRSMAVYYAEIEGSGEDKSWKRSACSLPSDLINAGAMKAFKGYSKRDELMIEGFLRGIENSLQRGFFIPDYLKTFVKNRVGACSIFIFNEGKHCTIMESAFVRRFMHDVLVFDLVRVFVTPLTAK
eukprot:CAMPEP_0197038878 /NCGR_PEP_ID=MMETSP1384-20130603/15757_1 /TAXON_ID=29189 /ORGANISM="Ammonia sp." /LENGTH=220 /DNA_ID=CAMNT_0042469379 /DNA_START=74 /DNA_END=734 /DNA_ORIENTATION=-